MAKLIYPLTESVLEKADLKAAIKVINSKKITMGQKTQELESFFKDKISKVNSLMVNSGSSANLLIFLAAPITERAYDSLMTIPLASVFVSTRRLQSILPRCTCSRSFARSSDSIKRKSSGKRKKTSIYR